MHNRENTVDLWFGYLITVVLELPTAIKVFDGFQDSLVALNNIKVK